MEQVLRELEGTWEEILEHADELAGHQVHVTVLASETKNGAGHIKHPEMLEVLDELKRNPLSAEEIAILDERELVPSRQQNDSKPQKSDWEDKPLHVRSQEMKALLAEYRKTPLTAEEIAVLDEMEEYNRDHRFTLRPVEDNP